MYPLIYILLPYLFSPHMGHSKQQTESGSDLRQQCMIDLCGPVNTNPRYIFNNNTFDKEDIKDIDSTIKRFNENILPIVEEAIQARLDYENKVLTKLQNPDVNISPEEWDEAAQYLYDTLHDAQLPLSYYGNKKKDFLTERYQEFLKEYEHKKTELTESDKENLIQLGQELNKGDFNPDNFAKSLDDLMRKVKTTSCSEKPSCKKRILDKLHNKLSGLRTESRISQNKENRINKALQYCRSQYAVNMTDALQSRAFKENLKDYKTRFLDRVFSDYSQVSRQTFENYINNTLKITFLSEESIDEIFTDIIKLSTSRNREKKTIISLLQIIKDLTIGDNLDQVCPGTITKYKPFSNDGFDSRKHTIRISAFSYTFYEHGKQILAHEMAHTLSHLFNSNRLSEDSYSKYKKLRECATKQYTINNKLPSLTYNNVRPVHKNDKYKTEEDTADLIAYKVFQEEPVMFNCVPNFIDVDNEKYRNQDVCIVDPEYFSEGTYYNGYIHSNLLLRAIMEAIHKRKELSPACQQVVDMYSDQINFEPCF